MGKFSDPHVCQCLNRIAALRRNSAVSVYGDRRQTGQQFVDSVLRLASSLRGLGVAPGDVIAISAFNSYLYLEWLLAIAFVGGIAAPLNYRWSLPEAKFAVSLVNPVMLVTDESCESWYAELHSVAMPSLRWYVSLSDSHPSKQPNKTRVLNMHELKHRSERCSPDSYSWAPEGAVIICFTSGTTGKPKGVTISHSALTVQSMAKIAICGYDEHDVYLHTAPLCHIGGLSSAMSMLMVGACHVLMPKFDAYLAIEVIEKWRVTSLITVPAMMADLIRLLRGKECWNGRETVKKILNGGGSLSPALIKGACTIFPKAKILSAYGN
ncbi:hypothetical protein SAY87_010508 [Trapa incisa]|uniref:AMP-dependent synthetase/ligase domain-containing protein n=1 Tax=Trapa incisa TaxID=236973 RepID=A0AAN7GHV7_9MYRT|nr:hypothetical protein SAY87_010508 [Trapa incisa]